jgi:hypothetical protein
MSAVILLQEIMLRRKIDPESAMIDDDDFTMSENSKDRKAVLAIAYHNMGVE